MLNAWSKDYMDELETFANKPSSGRADVETWNDGNVRGYAVRVNGATVYVWAGRAEHGRVNASAYYRGAVVSASERGATTKAIDALVECATCEEMREGLRKVRAHIARK